MKKSQLLLPPDHPVVRGHRIHGRHWLPGLAYIDLLHQVLRAQGFDLAEVALRDLRIFRPLEVENTEVTLEIAPTPVADGWRLEIAGGVHGAMQRYASASVQRVAPVAFDETLDMEHIRASASRIVPLDEIYAGCRADGLVHEGLIRAAGTVYVTDTALYVECEAQADAAGDGLLFHPALLDGAVVAATRLLDALDTYGDLRLLLPLMYASFRASGLLVQRCIARCSFNATRREGELRHLDMDFFDATGHKVAELKDFVGKRVREAVAPAAKPTAASALTSVDVGQAVRSLIAERLGRQAAQIEDDLGYYEMGLKSVQLLELASALETRLGVPLPPTLLFEHTTVAQLVAHLGGVAPSRAVTAAPARVQQPQPQPVSAAPTDIAIIGMAGRYPQAADLDAFWNNLRAGKDCVTEVPFERWDADAWFSADPDAPGRTHGRWGGFIDDVDTFDPLFFHISPREAETMDPQERLFLQAAWAALEDAGCTRESLRGAHGGRVGVYVGAMTQQYGAMLAEATGNASAPVNTFAAVANRVSHFFGFEGPSLAVDTMCSSGAVAIHLACADLAAGRCALALVGGVNLSLDPRKYLGLQQMNLLASRPGSRSFGQGDGFIPAEGVGAVLLKPLARAVADGDDILAVIKSGAVNHNGGGAGYTAPDLSAQARLVRDTLAQAGIDARGIGYVEAAANGSALGDAVEVAALAKVFGEAGVANGACAIGAVKSNIGHAEAASALSQLAKVVLQLRHGQLVPSIGAEPLNPALRLEDTPFRLQREAGPWNRQGETPRRALIDSFGAGGSNACLLVEEYLPPAAPVQDTALDAGPQVAVFSARSAERLEAMVRQMLAHLRAHEEIALAPLAFTLQTAREAMDWRLAIVTAHRADLLARMEAWLEKPVVTGSPDSRAGLKELLSGSVEATVAEALLREGRPDRIARFWEQGGKVPWAGLHAGKEMRRVKLPGYPFAQERYWLPKAGVAKVQLPVAAPLPAPTVQGHIVAFLASHLKLDAARIGLHTDLAEYGVDSILGLRLARSLQQAFDVRLSARDMLEHRTIAALAAHLGQPASAPMAQAPALPLSENQKGLWALHQLDPQSAAYAIPLCLRLRDAIDMQALRRACAFVAQRHPALNTVIESIDGMPAQRLDAPAPEPELEDISALTPDEVVPHLHQWTRRPFTLERGPLWRTGVFTRSPQEQYLLLAVHHLVCDARSLQLVATALLEAHAAFAAGTMPAHAEPPAAYADFVAWEQAFLASPRAETQRAYWKQQLAAPLPVIELPAEFPRAGAAARPDTLVHALDTDLSSRITAWCAARSVTPAMLFLAVYQLLLRRYTSAADIVVGMPTVGRPEERFDDVAGYFANVIAVRSRLDGSQPFERFLQDLQRTVADGLDHADFPFSRLVRELRLGGEAAPVFQAAFEFQSARVVDLERLPSGAEVLHTIGQQGEFELVLEVFERRPSYLLRLKYDAALRERAAVERMAGHLAVLLGAILQQPALALDDLPLLPEAEARTLLRDWNATQLPSPADLCVHDLIARQASATPDAVAASDAHRQLSYRELDSLSNQLAAWLRGQGIGAGGLVAIGVQRSVRMVVGLLGIWKAGAAYVPLDPDFPDERLRYMLADCRASLLLAETATADKLRPLLPQGARLVLLDAGWEDIAQATVADAAGTPRRDATLDDLAYLLYTSGSTGQPKGVMVTHRGVANLRAAMLQWPGLRADDRVLATTTYCFDISVVELHLPLTVGAQVHLCDAATVRDAQALREDIARVRPTLLQATPTTWALLFQAGWRNEERLRLFCGGEAISDGLRQRFVAAGCEVWNLYGPTETTVYSLGGPLEREGPITIGRPVANTQVYVVDARLRPVPIGIAGELCIAGDGLAAGYLHQPELTAQKFVGNPFAPGTRLYRTGDLARRLPDGRVEFLGRIDAQVKIRGFRIELGDVESALLRHPAVAGAAVVVQERDDGKRLVACWVPADGSVPVDPRALREHLRAVLPEYMVPAKFVQVPALPLTGSGKVDRKALLAQVEATAAPALTAVATSSELEERVRAIWRQVLEVDDIRADDGFFAIGGDSLSAVAVAQRIAGAFGVAFTPTALFKHASVRGIGRYLAQAGVAGTAAPIPAPPVAAQPALALPPPNSGRPGDVAIIGISCQFPDARDHRAFWDNLRTGTESLRLLSAEELRAAGVPEHVIANPRYVPVRSSIEGKDLFDPAFFHISARDAQLLDPQARLLLMHAWKAVEDAGYVARRIPDTAVFMSASNSFYQGPAGLPLNASGVIEHADAYVSWMLAQAGTLPALISHKLGLKGQSLAVHSNCSSSLSALHAACRSIQSGEAGQALVGASTLFATGRLGYLHQDGLNFSGDGHLRAFDAAADGMVPGEGVAVVLLKDAARAVADGDHIYAIVRGIAVNNDGADKAGFYAPSVGGQADVIRKALDAARVDPASIGYVEAHGTGTRLGDPIELQALAEAYAGAANRPASCGLGSVKTNIGHLDTAAGLAGCIKLALSLTHGELPPSLHYRAPNPGIDFARTPFYVVDTLRPWPRGDAPRRAALSAFGIGGTNTHAIFEEAPEQSLAVTGHAGPFVVPLSAKTRERLDVYARELLGFLRAQAGTDLERLAYTLQVGREAMTSRVAFVVRDLAQLLEQLQLFVDGKTASDCFIGDTLQGRPGLLADDEDDARQLVERWVAAHKWTRLARAWTTGLDVRWERLYTVRPHRMSLPTYPFAQERYWIETPATQAPAAAHLHPLLHANTSDFHAQRFSSTFSGAEFFLADHQVQGRPVLPAVAQLEMARAAMALASGEAGTLLRLKNVVFARPVMVQPPSTAVQVTLWPQAEGGIAYEIASAAGGDAVVHSRGTGELMPAAGPQPRIDLGTVRAVCAKSLDAAAFYAVFDRLGFSYGPSLRAVTSLAHGVDAEGRPQALAHIALPHALAATQDAYLLHPSLLDAALQAAVGLQMGAAEPIRLALPFALEQLEILAARIPAQLFAWVRYGTGGKIDIDVCDEHGAVQVGISGYTARVLESAVVTNDAPLLLAPAWEAQPLPTVSGQPSQWALLAPGLAAHAAGIGAKLQAARCVVLDADYTSAAAQALELLREVMQARQGGPVLLSLVVPQAGEDSLHAGLLGLLRSACQENPKLAVQRLVWNPDTGLQLLRVRWNDLPPASPAMPWKDQGVYLLTGGLGGLGLVFAREIARQVRSPVLVLAGRSAPDEAAQLRLDELRALGADAHPHVVDVADATTVQDLVNGIVQRHGRLDGVVHAAGVLADGFLLNKTEAQLRAVLAPKVAGTLNLDATTAGLPLDCFILFSSVVATLGNLGQGDYAAANGFLDAFSAHRNRLAAEGQRHGRTLSVGWPLWAEGGMRASAQTQARVRETFGLEALPTQAGVQSLSAAWGAGVDHAVVLAGDRQRLRKAFDEAPTPERPSPAVAEPPHSTAPQPGDSHALEDKTLVYLKRILADAVKLPASRIEADAPLEQYGIDSILVLQLTEALEKDFGSLSKTLFFEYQSLRALARHFIAAHAGRLPQVVGHSASAQATVAVTSAPAPAARPRFLLPAAAPTVPIQPASDALDVAIIGVAGRYPQARTLREFWHNLSQGRDSITEIPPERWDHSRHFDPDKEREGTTYGKWGGFMDGVEEFDPLFFNISPREAQILDPQERLFVQCVWETLEDAGYTRERLARLRKRELEGNVGVFVGVMYEEYQLYGPQFSASPSSIANRVSWFCNFHGPSMAVDTMCSSSLTAIHLACQSLREGGCEVAIAGGVNVSIHPNKYLFLARGRFISSKGRCESFGEGGDGYVPGEGVGAVLLKPLARAIADGDRIYGVIKGTAVNHGGKTNGYSVPNPVAQAAVIRQAMERAGVHPRAVSYIEAHGTGTSLGDPIEIAGLVRAFAEQTQDRQFCAIGSAKSNIGHCESAAGIAGLTKVLLQLKHGQIAPSLHSEVLNPHIDFAATPFTVQQQLAEWKRPVASLDGGPARELPRIAGISSFGAGGANAHLVIQEYVAPRVQAVHVTQDRPAVIVLSARDSERLHAHARNLLQAITEDALGDGQLTDLAYTLQIGREAMEERLAFTAASMNEVVDTLRRFISGDTSVDAPYRGNAKRDRTAVALFTSDEDLKQAVASWLTKGKFTQLAELWAKGLPVNWEPLHAAARPWPLSLPAYPFARERHWGPDHVQQPAHAGNASVLHPLLHRNTSSFAEQRYSAVFEGSEFFLADHRVGGARVLPGVVSLEMVRAALADAAEINAHAGITLRNIAWLRPLTVDAQPVAVDLVLQPGEAGVVAFEVRTGARDGEATVHAQGEALLEAKAQPAAVDLSMLAAQCATPLSVDQCYQDFGTMGIAYGPAHRALETLHSGTDGAGRQQALARLRLPACVADSRDRFLLHPSLMDAALQATLGLSDPSQARTAAMPFALAELNLFAALPDAPWVLVRESEPPRGEVRKFDIDLLDDDGSTCVQLRGFSTRALAQAATPAAPPVETPALTGTLMLAPVWEPQDVEPDTNFPAADARVLLVGGTPEEQAIVRRRWPGAQGLDPLQTASQVDHVVWLAPASRADSVTAESLVDDQQRGVLACFRLAKALLATGHDAHPLGWTVVTRQAVATGPRAQTDPTHASLHGLMGSLAKEYPHWRVRVADLPADDMQALNQALLLPPDPNGDVCAWRNGQWLRQQLVQVKDTGGGRALVKDDGVYVVIGGAGGIGEVWSEAMLRAHRARIVWIGRRPLDDAIQAKLARLGALGPAPHYIAADATRGEELLRAWREIKQLHGHIDGIVHAAIVLQDQGIAAMDEARFQASLAAKVDVSVRLAQVFAEEPLDFVLFFSSAQSFVKAAGQSNYAAGCTFKDAFAQALARQWPCAVKVMNWGYWGSIGIVAEAAYQQRMARAGIGSIEPAEGMAALAALLASPLEQVALIKTTRPLALDSLRADELLTVHADTLPAQPDPVLPPRPVPTADNLDADDALLCRLLRAQLRVAGVLREGAATLAQRMAVAGVAERHAPWMRESFAALAAQGVLRHEGDLWLADASLVEDSDTVWAGWDARKTGWLANPNRQAQARLLETALRALPDVLSGKRTATDVLFPDASMALVEGIYKNNRQADHFNAVLADALVAHVQARAKADPAARLRLLEIGAGTGGTAAVLFERLRPHAGHIGEYAYTDISRAFLLHAEQEYGAANPYLAYRLFNVEQPVAPQGLDAGGYDAVIATNVLHATRDIRQTLRNAKALLRRGGLLLVNEIAQKQLFSHLTFGLLDGWWRYEDAPLRLPGSPALSPESWRRVLECEGFHGVAFPAVDAHALGQQVIAARSDGVVRQRRAVAAVPAPKAPPAPQAARPPVHVRIEHTARAATAATGVTPQLLREAATAHLKTLLGRTLKIEPQRIDASEPLESYGIDSILVVQFSNALRGTFPEVSSTLLFEHRTIEALVSHFMATESEAVRRLAEQSLPAHADTAASASVPAPATPVVSRPLRRVEPARATQALPATTGTRDVAIVGLSGRYPQADNVHAFWRNLAEGRNCISAIPPDRWDWQRYTGTIASKWGGFLDGIDCFDARFFRISPKEAERTDPQERLFLQEAYAAIEDAGHTPATLGERVGVFVGVMNSTYARNSAYWSIANRVSFLLDFKGPSLAVDTACSSSLTAIHLALESIANGSADCAIAGGVSLIVDPLHYQLLSSFTMLTAGDRCKSFGDGADGFVDGEGVGAVVLKPLTRAVADGDRIYGVIKASAVNHGGRTNGYSVPDPAAQADVIAQALERAGVHPRAVSYVEAHGTGTALGDPIEIAGLAKAFSARTADRQFCAIGSAKSNIGHCESAAGIAALTKVLLQMRHGQIAPSLHAEVPNPHIDFAATPFAVQQELAQWKRPVVSLDGGPAREVPRIAGISSFGAGGANAHLVIEEYVAPPAQALHVAPERPALVVLSARTEERLREQARRLLQAIADEQLGDDQLADLAYTLQVGREAMEERLAFTASSMADVNDTLRRFAAAETGIDRLHRASVRDHKPAMTALVADEDHTQLVTSWIAKGKVGKLAELWTQGYAIDWRALQSGPAMPRRIGLPTYPFARERHWRRDAEAPDTVPGQVVTANLHPLLHANTSTLEVQRFSSRFSGSEPFFADHVVQGRRVLPGVAALEMAREAVVRSTSGASGVMLRNVVWLRPVVIGDGALDVHIELLPQENGIAFEICSGGELHAQGLAVVALETARPRADLNLLRAQCALSIPAARCYEAFTRMGIAYGPTHRAIEALSTGADAAGQRQVLARLRRMDGDATGCALPPGLADAALQAAIGFTLNDSDGVPALPFALNALEVFAPCPADAWAIVRADGGTFDVDICDDTGAVCVRFTGLGTRPTDTREARTALFVPHWEAQSVNASQVHDGEHWIVLAPPMHGAAAAIRGSVALDRLLLLDKVVGIAAGYTAAAELLLRELQALFAAKPQRQVLIQLVVSDGAEHPLWAGLYGMLQSARHEHPKLVVQLIACDAGETPAQLARQLLDNRGAGDGRIRYRDGVREVAAWQEIPTAAAVPAWRDRGVYLITGGAGGLGLLCAQEIARCAKAPVLVLVGRSVTSDALQARLQPLEAAGARVEYHAADVTDRAAVVALIEHVTRTHGRLDSILHAAGVLRDGTIAGKPPEDLHAVLAPKVAGTVNLDEATRQLPLDCFVLFSSVSGALGNAGQADYAAANAFLDAYAAYRDGLVAAGQRSGRSLSVNWPLWAEGGMDLRAEDRERLAQRTGQRPLETVDGLRALDACLAAGAPQLLVAHGDVERIRDKLLRARTPEPLAADSAPPTDAGALPPEVERQLAHMVCELLKLRPEEIDPRVELGEYGFDSISFTQFANAVNDAWGLEIAPPLFFEHSSLRALAAHLVQAHLTVFAAPVVAEETPPSRRARFAQAPTPAMEPAADPVAIIGISGCFPLADDPDALWRNLLDGRDCIREVPPDRWDWRALWGDPARQEGKTNIKWGGFIDGVAEFDAQFFGISPREAELMDPQQRLLMTHVWKAIEDAGYAAESLAGTRTALFAGIGNSGYGAMVPHADGYSATGAVPSVGPNRMSYFLDLHGPSEPVETACSSALVAVHRALSAMERDGCEMAIAGGVNVLVSPDAHVSFGRAGMLSEDGRCKTFSARANGYVRAEGAGFLVLKKLSAAERDGDRIHGLVRASAENHGGRANSLTAPNHRAQEALLVDAYTRAGIDPRTVGYIEVHGTGTALGDPIEVNALKGAFQQLYSQTDGNAVPVQPHCGIASVKSNIGHLELAAGVAGIVKVLLQLKHKTLAKSLHCEDVNPYIDLKDSPFFIVRENQPWQAPRDANGRELPRRAGVSSFGFGGTNAHVVIEEYVPPVALQRKEPVALPGGIALVVLSARNPERLREQARQLLSAVEERRFTDADLAGIAWTLQAGRSAMEERLAFTAASIGELRAKLERFLAGATDGLHHGQLKRAVEAGTAADVPNDPDQLLAAWVRGLAVHWGRLYGTHCPRRIALPTYPFARERHWTARGGAVPAPEPTKTQPLPGDDLLKRLLDGVRDELLPLDDAVNEARKAMA
ncbi:MAG: amino acid adenylation domain-containing protein [Pseudomonadota bacterium]